MGGEVMIYFFKLISDEGNIIISKLITYVGVSVGIGGGAVQVAVANNAAAKVIQECAEQAPDWITYAPAIAALSLVIKNVADVYFKARGKKKGDA